LRVSAVYSTAEVRHFALVALVICHLEHGKLPQLVKVMVIGVFETRVFVKFLKFGAFEGFLLDVGFNLQCLIEQALQHGAVLAVYRFLARRTVKEVECNARRDPLFLEKILYAVVVEDVATANLDRRFGA